MHLSTTLTNPPIMRYRLLVAHTTEKGTTFTSNALTINHYNQYYKWLILITN